jgi:hypothetical protein
MHFAASEGPDAAVIYRPQCTEINAFLCLRIHGMGKTAYETLSS